MDFAVTEQFAATAAPLQLHAEARGTSADWPAAFVQQDDGTWVYRVEEREGVTIDTNAVEAAIASHAPQQVATPDEALHGALERARATANGASTVAALKGALLEVLDALTGTTTDASVAATRRPQNEETP